MFLTLGFRKVLVTYRLGGGGSSGGSSGAVDFPAYMKTWHGAFLGDASGVTVTVAGALEAAMNGASPYASYVPLSANTIVLGTGKTITDFSAPFALLATYNALDFDTILAAYKISDPNGLGSFISNADSTISTLMAAEGVVLENELNQVTIPNFQTGMRDANAIMSSAYLIGEALIRNRKTIELAKNDAALRHESFKLCADLTVKNTQILLDYTTKKILSKRDIATTAMDFAKIYAGIHIETDDIAVEMAAKDVLFDLKCLQYGGNFLGNISGSAVSTDHGSGNRTAGSIIGGAIGGASMGFMVGGPWGAAIGAVAGGVMGALS